MDLSSPSHGSGNFRGLDFRGLVKSLGRLAICLALSQCSVSLENPEADARLKLAKVIPTTMDALVGRWEGDSTFNVEDTRTSDYGYRGMHFEIFADTTVSILDTSKLTFPVAVEGRIRLSGDTLFLLPSPKSAGSPDTFLVKLRFLGNRLELDHPSDQRYSFFHKRKPIDSTVQDSLLRDSLWLLLSRKFNPDSTSIEPLLRDFSYLRFPIDSMDRDWHRNGVFRTESGKLSKQGRKWTWKTATGTREFFADLIHNDSLRIWPLVDGRPDSGFDLFLRANRPHPMDLDMRPLLGYMRTDSIRHIRNPVENHYGRFYDLVFAEDHSVQTLTNMPALPKYASWTLDTGRLRLEGPSDVKVLFRIDTTQPKVVMLTTDSGAYFKVVTDFYQTKVDGSRFQDHPLERFDQASYAHVILGTDTLRYYFSVNYTKAAPDQHEILQPDTGNGYWLTLDINPAQESFQISQPGFRFILEGHEPALGRFTCRALPENDLVIRLNASKDPSMAQGLLQGHCHVLSSQIAPADSNLEVDGSFRLKRKRVGDGMASPLWRLP